jgi:excisionase family DNA binding protein
VSRSAISQTSWLSLAEASRLLDVHPTTLREWADKGRIRTFRTPGGHRRFSEADVIALGDRGAADLSLLMNATVGHARIATTDGQLAAESWYSRFDEAAKARQRQLGLDLMRLLVSYLGETDSSWAAEIRAIGGQYAELARGVRLSLGDAMRAFHLFEEMARESVNQMTAAGAGGERDLDRHVGWFLNEVRVAMAESYAGGEA